MEFLEFPVETSLPLLNYRLGVQHWELYETALAKSSQLERSDSLAPLSKLTSLGKNNIYVFHDLASLPQHVSLENNLEHNVSLAPVLGLNLRRRFCFFPPPRAKVITAD